MYVCLDHGGGNLVLCTHHKGVHSSLTHSLTVNYVPTLIVFSSLLPHQKNHPPHPQELQERLASAEASSRDLVEAKNRLEEHVADLEKRKRAPLYQKKQEEELRAAVDKAQDAEARAAEAEARFKDAKV